MPSTRTVLSRRLVATLAAGVALLGPATGTAAAGDRSGKPARSATTTTVTTTTTVGDVVFGATGRKNR